MIITDRSDFAWDGNGFACPVQSLYASSYEEEEDLPFMDPQEQHRLSSAARTNGNDASDANSHDGETISETLGDALAWGFLVGAAGFEPATCSTQNCRATRLRYTPVLAALDICFGWRQQGDACRSAQAVP